MTSSCQGSNTVRPVTQEQRTSFSSQQDVLHASIANERGLGCGLQLGVDYSQLFSDYHTEKYWPTGKTQKKDQDTSALHVLSPGASETAPTAPWLTWSSTWEHQAAPGTEEWQSLDTITRLQADQSVNGDSEYTDSWLHEQSYPCSQAPPDQEALWTQLTPWPRMNGRNEQSHQNYNQMSHHELIDKRYSGMNIDQSKSTVDRYPFSSPGTQSTHDSYLHGSGTSSWYAPGTKSNDVGIEVTQQLHDLEEPIPAYHYTPKSGWYPVVEEASPPIVNPSAHNPSHSPEWSTRSLSQNNSTSATLSSDLIPDPPRTMIDPPAEDMNPRDRSLLPQRRELKDSNHLYMPRWIRGHGQQREGWCGACRPGRWLSLKRSTYWYHKNFCHGITTMGTSFPRPVNYRQARDEKSLEGLCKSCNKWIPLNGNKKHQTQTSWFRHAYKCNSSNPVRVSSSSTTLFR